MNVIIRPDAVSATEYAASILKDHIRKQPKSVLGLATGRTMERLYDKLVEYHDTEGLDFSHCTTFNLDEYVGLSPEDKNSYRYYMNHHLFSKINIDLKKTHLPSGVADNLRLEAAIYEEKIAQSGGIDIQLLGIGRSGHIAFNEPLSSLTSRTREVILAEETMLQNQPLFDKPEDMPRRAMTMGVGTILEAKKIILVATGKGKAEILAKAIEGPMTSMISASALQMHQNCIVIADEEAAELLEGKAYYKHMFEEQSKKKLSLIN